MNNKKWCHRVWVGCMGLALAGHVYADCQVRNVNALIGLHPSFAVDDGRIGVTPFEAGLACTGLAALLNQVYMRYTVEEVSGYLENQQGARLLIKVLDRTDNSVIAMGLDKDLSSYSLINLFNGPNGAVQMNAEIPAGQNAVPGVYTGVLKLRWYYSIPGVAVIGLGFFYESPGFRRGGFFGGFRWGSGIVSHVKIQLEVKEDCIINVQDIEFGEAALPSAFEAVKGTMKVRCSAKTPYEVGLSDGLGGGSGKRAMSDGQNNRLNYEVYKGNGSERWGAMGAERWPSDQASTNAGVYDGKTVQSYVYTAKILPEEGKYLPSGIYTDRLYLEVKF